MTQHEHKWGRGYREVDVPVIDGVATMPDGSTIESTANIVRYPEPIDDFVCGVCGAMRDTPAEHPQTPRRSCDPPTTHRYETVMTADGRAFTSRIRCKRCGYEREG